VVEDTPVVSAAEMERRNGCYIALFLCSDSPGSMQFYNMTALPKRTTDGHSSFFALRSVFKKKSVGIIDIGGKKCKIT